MQKLLDRKYMEKFLKARKHDLNKAEQMLVDHIGWRYENRIDERCAGLCFSSAGSSSAGGENENPSPRLEVKQKLQEYYPHGYYGVSKEGFPMYWERTGQLNLKMVLNVMTERQFVDYFVGETERTLVQRHPACTRWKGGMIGQNVNVIDASGGGSSFLNKTTRRVLGELSSVLSDNYPETVKALYIVNTSRLFSMLWPAIRVFVNPETAKKLKIVSKGKTLAELEKICDRKFIPSFLGGDYDGELCDYGPWRKEFLDREGRGKWDDWEESCSSGDLNFLGGDLSAPNSARSSTDLDGRRPSRRRSSQNGSKSLACMGQKRSKDRSDFAKSLLDQGAQAVLPPSPEKVSHVVQSFNEVKLTKEVNSLSSSGKLQPQSSSVVGIMRSLRPPLPDLPPLFGFNNQQQPSRLARLASVLYPWGRGNDSGETDSKQRTSQNSLRRQESLEEKDFFIPNLEDEDGRSKSKNRGSKERRAARHETDSDSGYYSFSDVDTFHTSGEGEKNFSNSRSASHEKGDGDGNGGGVKSSQLNDVLLTVKEGEELRVGGTSSSRSLSSEGSDDSQGSSCRDKLMGFIIRVVTFCCPSRSARGVVGGGVV